MNIHTLTLCVVLAGANMAWADAPAAPMKSATVDELVEQLAPPPARTRSLRNIAPQPVAPRSIDLVIQFDFDSARLQDASKPLLDNLASAMRNERLSTLRFRVEGHTDAKGSEAYNLQLSRRRAETVQAYLMDKGIERERLSAEGKGFGELLMPDKPQAAENRRVRITTQD